MRVQILYNGLNYQIHQLIDATTYGSLRSKYPDDAEELIENMAKNESHWGSRTKITQTQGFHEVNDKTILVAKYEALAKQVSLLISERSEWASSSAKQVMNYETCGEGNNWGNQSHKKFPQPPGFQTQQPQAQKVERKFSTKDV